MEKETAYHKLSSEVSRVCDFIKQYQERMDDKGVENFNAKDCLGVVLEDLQRTSAFVISKQNDV